MTQWIQVPQRREPRGERGAAGPTISLQTQRHGMVLLNVALPRAVAEQLGWTLGEAVTLLQSPDGQALRVERHAGDHGRPLRSWGRHKGSLGAQFRVPGGLDSIVAGRVEPPRWAVEAGGIVMTIPPQWLEAAAAARVAEAPGPEGDEEQPALDLDLQPVGQVVPQQSSTAQDELARIDADHERPRTQPGSAPPICVQQLAAPTRTPRLGVDDPLLAPPGPTLKTWIMQHTNRPEHRDPKALSGKTYAGLVAIANGIRRQRNLPLWVVESEVAA